MTEKMDRRLVILGEKDDLLGFSPVIAETLAVSAAEGHGAVLLLRRQRPYVLLGPQDRRLPDLKKGLAFWQKEGIPVFDRVTGGSAVFLDSTCLSFGVAEPCRDIASLQRNYSQMGEGILTALRSLGLDASFGAARGSYCEGPYDVVTGGQKIAGVAQAIRGGYALLSGMILVRQDPIATTQRLNQFYRASGKDADLKGEAVTNLCLALDRDVTVDEVEEAVIQTWKQMYPTEQIPVQKHERLRAQQLLSMRRLA